MNLAISRAQLIHFDNQSALEGHSHKNPERNQTLQNLSTVATGHLAVALYILTRPIPILDRWKAMVQNHKEDEKWSKTIYPLPQKMAKGVIAHEHNILELEFLLKEKNRLTALIHKGLPQKITPPKGTREAISDKLEQTKKEVFQLQNLAAKIAPKGKTPLSNILESFKKSSEDQTIGPEATQGVQTIGLLQEAKIPLPKSPNQKIDQLLTGGLPQPKKQPANSTPGMDMT